MKTDKMSVCLALSGLSYVLLTGCGGGGNSTPTGPIVSATRQFGSLQFTLSTPRSTYAEGEPVPLTFTITNVGTQTVNTSTAGCADYYAVLRGKQDVGPEGFGCAPEGYKATFTPGETKTVEDNWYPFDTQGKKLPAGKYTITYWLGADRIDETTIPPGDGKTALAANPIQVTIQAP